MPELQVIIDATEGSDLTFLTNEHGQPFRSADSFGNAFRRWSKAAGLSECSPHGLRKVAAVRLAESGASTLEIMAVGGWSTLKEVERYTRGAGQRVRAESAMRRLSASSDKDEKSHQSVRALGWDESDAQTTENKDETDGMVPGGGIEPPTLRFSVACSTN